MNKNVVISLRLAICALTGLLVAAPLQAQIGGSGSIQGVVSDSTGAVVPGVTVSATNVATGVANTRTTTPAGYYVISPLQPGEYTVTVSATGFEKLTQQHVIVDALAQVAVNLTVKLGQTTEEVTVSAAPPPLNTSDASMGQTVRNDVYGALPLAMSNAPRDPTSFTQLLPGVSTSSATGNTAGNVLGSQDHSQEIYVEGLPTTNPSAAGESRTLGLGISVEAVDQFQLETAGTAAMYQGQGASNYVLKSGGNQFHGAGYEYFRNTSLDARGFFAPKRPTEHQNEFGFNVSGPVKKDKIFFFANYDGFRFTQQAQPSLASIPTEAERNGNFSGLPAADRIYDPATTVCAANGVCSRQMFPGNIIPQNRISPASKFLQSNLPATTNSALQNNFLQNASVGYHDNSTTDKVDINLNDRNQMYVLFSHGHRSQTTPYRGQTLPLPYASTRMVDEVPTIAQAKYTFVATPSLVNQLSYGLSRFNVPITNVTIDGDWMTKAGVTGLPAGEAASSFPEVSFSGPNSPDNWRASGGGRAFNDVQNTFTLQDNLQWTHGKHAITMGAQMQWQQANEKARTYGSLATWTFSNGQTAGFGPTGTLLTTTGNSYASYLLGGLSSANVVEDSVVATGGRYRDFSWWVQDNYKVTSRLTLNLGLRHDIWSPYVEVNNRESFFNPTVPNPAAGGAPGVLQFYGYGPNSCGCRTNIATSYKNFGPRVGLAYQVTKNTVVRAGYSIMYTHRGAVGGRGGGRYGTDLFGYSANPTFTGPNDGFTPAFYWDNGVPPYQAPPFFDPTYGTGFNGTGNAPAGLNYGDPQLGGMPPRYQNWNLAIERTFFNNLTLGVAYVGNNGHYLSGGGRGIWSDQMNPAYLALGNLLQLPANAANLAKAQAIVPGVSLPYPTFSGTISQMLRTFPQYSNITDLWGDVGNSNYNSLQIYLNKRLSTGLTFNFNYVYAKAFDDTASNMVSAQSFTLGSAYNWKNQKAMTQLPGHTVNLLAVYQLPFGKNRTYLNGDGIVSKIAGDWQLSGILTYRSGLPIGTIGAACNTPNAGGCYANYNPAFSGPVRINGGWGSGNLIGSNASVFLDKNAFVSPAAYTYGNTPRTNVYGIQNPGTYDEDISLKREFSIRENLKVAIQADAFNVFNLVTFASPSTNITSSNFGKISAQSNSPRILQLGARVSF